MPRPRLLLFAAVLSLVVIGGGARAATPGDPFERFNRWAFRGSLHLDRVLLAPVARIYAKLTPGPIGQAIHNFIANLGEPVVIANDILQARLKRATDDIARVVTNTTVGIGGLIDVAATQGLPFRDNDFGVTLGRWGVGPGPYLFLPVIGPSTLRDAVGHGVDTAFSPLPWVSFSGRGPLLISAQILSILDQRERAGAQMDALLGGAADPYATLRSVYLQSREAEIHGESAEPILPSLDPGASAAPDPGAPTLAVPPAPALAATDPAAAPDATQAAAPSATGAAADAAAVASDAPIMTARAYDVEGVWEAARQGAGA